MIGDHIKVTLMMVLFVLVGQSFALLWAFVFGKDVFFGYLFNLLLAFIGLGIFALVQVARGV